MAHGGGHGGGGHGGMGGHHAFRYLMLGLIRTGPSDWRRASAHMKCFAICTSLALGYAGVLAGENHRLQQGGKPFAFFTDPPVAPPAPPPQPWWVTNPPHHFTKAPS